MKKILAITLAACVLAPAFAQTNVGVSIGINQPGMYGRIDIGNFPQPRIIYPQPVIIAPGPVAVYQQPGYLYVPPGHQKNWGKHCYRYNACGQPVYFVQEDWVRERYDERRGYDNRRDDRHDNGRGHGKGRNKHDRED
jgi:hypothetical protein